MLWVLDLDHPLTGDDLVEVLRIGVLDVALEGLLDDVSRVEFFGGEESALGLRFVLLTVFLVGVALVEDGLLRRLQALPDLLLGGSSVQRAVVNPGELALLKRLVTGVEMDLVPSVSCVGLFV